MVTRVRFVALGCGVAIACATILALAPSELAAASNQPLPPTTAAKNYELHCQGCHTEDGSKTKDIVPPLAGHVATYLWTPKGRDYLVQVPGSSNSMLNDQELAELLTWMVKRFDPGNVPADFKPYTAHEVAVLRRNPLSNPVAVRERLLEEVRNGTHAARPEPAKP